jgi:hypothetical protein
MLIGVDSVDEPSAMAPVTDVELEMVSKHDIPTPALTEAWSFFMRRLLLDRCVSRSIIVV